MRQNSFLRRNKQIMLVFVFLLLVISIMQFRVSEIIGFDGWLHIKSADMIRDKGFVKEFPYISESILSENYADIQFMFRVLLIPFTFLGLTNGAKVASILFSSLCFAFFFWYLKKKDIHLPLLWTSIYAVSSVNLMYRFLLPRAMPLAVLSLILTFYFMEKRMYKSLLLSSLLFAWLYHGFVFQLVAISMYFILNLFINKKIEPKLLIYPFTGAILAIIINPYFPNNLSLLYTQLFKVNLIGNLFNQEWRSWNLRELLMFNYLLFSLLIASFIVTVKRMKLKKNTLFFLVITILSLIAMIKTRRMHEYFAPFTVIFASISLNDYTAKLKERKALKVALIILVALIAIFSLVKLDTYTKNNHILPWYKEGAEFTKEIPKGSKVFINGYTFNYLFFHNPDLRYTHGIDLTYSFLHDKNKFSRYMSVLQGNDPGFNIIKQDYNADYAIVGKIKQDIKLFDHVVKYKEDFELVYEDESVGILKVRR